MTGAPAVVPARPDDHRGRSFHIQLDNFDGPFDLLLRLIAQHRMDVTEVALSAVTDEFIAHLRSLGDDWELGQATEFLVVAATLLDLKAARLLPAADVEDEDDLQLLEARDLLFARLLAYRAYQQVADLLRELEATALRRYPRAVELESRYAGLLPEVEIGITAEAFAEFAGKVFRPKPAPPTVSLAHLHSAPVSVADETAAIREILSARTEATFAELTRVCPSTLHVVARFLALLNLFRDAQVGFEQLEPLGRLTIRWTGRSAGEASRVEGDDS